MPPDEMGDKIEKNDGIFKYCIEGGMGVSVGRPSCIQVSAGEIPAKGVDL